MRKTCLVLLILIALVAGFRFTEEKNQPIHNESEERIYPTNDAGLTYGPDVKENIDPACEPDLLLVCNKDGTLGYIRAADIKEGATSLEEAINWKPRSYTIPMYLEDGETVIGEFQITDEITIVN